MHSNWSNRPELFFDDAEKMDNHKISFLRTTYPYNELFCIECNKVKDFGFSPNLGCSFSPKMFPINFNPEKDLIE